MDIALAIGESVNNGKASRSNCLREERDHSTDKLWFSVLFDYLIGAAEIRDRDPGGL
jgi:hypothetical protein